MDEFPDFGLTFGNPDFVRYAESYGAHGHRVEATHALIPTLEAAFQVGDVHVVAMPIDYSENIRVLVEELRELEGAGAGPPPSPLPVSAAP